MAVPRGDFANDDSSKQASAKVFASDLSISVWEELQSGTDIRAGLCSGKMVQSANETWLNLNADIFGKEAKAPDHKARLAEIAPIDSEIGTVLEDACIEFDLSSKEIDLDQIKDKVCTPETPECDRIFQAYGAMFAAGGDVTLPEKTMFGSAEEVEEFHNDLDLQKKTIAGKKVTLQSEAMEALLAARKEARKLGIEINPAADDSSLRSFDKTVELWKSRVEPALAHWVKAGKISKQDAEELRKMPIKEQISAVLDLEEEGLYFSKDFKKSILSSVAAPGTSQHLSGLALDIAGTHNPQVRDILNKHGWFQTVPTDLPHFTYLGVNELHLGLRDLQQRQVKGRSYWTPEPKQ